MLPSGLLVPQIYVLRDIEMYCSFFMFALRPPKDFREGAILNARAGYPRNDSLREIAVELISDFEESFGPKL